MSFQRRRISDAGLNLLKAFEKCRLFIYFDSAGKATIYWGHLIRHGEQFNHTQEQADQVLWTDLAPVENCVHAWFPADMPQNHFDAFCCFAFNEGAPALQTSTMSKLYLAGDIAGAAEQFLRWDKEHDPHTGCLVESEGLLKRREAEQALFLGKPWSPP